MKRMKNRLNYYADDGALGHVDAMIETCRSIYRTQREKRTNKKKKTRCVKSVQ